MVAWSVAIRGAAGDIEWTLTLDNFRRLAGFDAFGWTRAYLAILGTTILVSAVTTIVTIALAYPLAFFIARGRRRSRYLWLALIIIPFCTNLVIRTYAWMLLLGNQMPLARLAQWLHLVEPVRGPVPLHASRCTSAWSPTPCPSPCCRCTPTWRSWTGPSSRRAATCTRGPVRVFLHAILPQTLPGLVTAVILTFIPAMGAFVIPDLLGGGKSWMLGNLIQHQFGVSRDFPFGAAVSLVLTFLTMVGLLVLRRSGDEVSFL